MLQQCNVKLELKIECFAVTPKAIEPRARALGMSAQCKSQTDNKMFAVSLVVHCHKPQWHRFTTSLICFADFCHIGTLWYAPIDAYRAASTVLAITQPIIIITWPRQRKICTNREATNHFFFLSFHYIFYFLFCYFIVGNEIVSGRHRWLTAALQCYTMKHHLIFHPAIYNNNNIVSGHRRRVIIFIIRLGLPAAVAWCRRGRIGTNTSAAAAHCNVTTHSSCKLHSE